jgi:hypothetical protein
VFQLEPAGADGQLGTAAGDDVEGGHRLGQQRRVPVRVAGDQRGQPHGGGVLRQGRQQRVALEHLVLGWPEHRQLVEVVHHHDRVEAAGIGLARLPRDGAEEIDRQDVGIGEVRDLIAEFGHGNDDTSGCRR